MRVLLAVAGDRRGRGGGGVGDEVRACDLTTPRQASMRGNAWKLVGRVDLTYACLLASVYGCGFGQPRKGNEIIAAKGGLFLASTVDTQQQSLCEKDMWIGCPRKQFQAANRVVRRSREMNNRSALLRSMFWFQFPTSILFFVCVCMNVVGLPLPPVEYS